MLSFAIRMGILFFNLGIIYKDERFYDGNAIGSQIWKDLIHI
jgi:hypothetical protein